MASVRQFDGKQVTPFYGFRHPLSNFHYSPLVKDGKSFSCVEQCYVFKKCGYFGDYRRQRIVLKHRMTPAAMKNLGKHIRNFDNRKWEGVKVKIMAEILEAKYNQNPHLSRFLLGTGHNILIEANKFDSFWGAGASFEEIKTGKAWTGKNVMGILLMEVRMNIRRRKPKFPGKCDSLEKLHEYQVEQKLKEPNSIEDKVTEEFKQLSLKE